MEFKGHKITYSIIYGKWEVTKNHRLVKDFIEVHSLIEFLETL